jgi:hypothetical protein
MFSHLLRVALLSACVFSVTARISAQVIEFENGGLRYQSLTRGGVTIMFARLPIQLRQFSLIQVALSNGSEAYANLKPEDFTFKASDGSSIPASSARDVVGEILEHGNHSDLVKLVTTY